MIQLFCVIVATKRQQSINLCHWFRLSQNQTISHLLIELNRFFEPRSVKSIAFTDSDDRPGMRFDRPVSSLNLSNPCTVCVELSQLLTPFIIQLLLIGAPSIEDDDEEQSLDGLYKTFVSASFAERLEILGVSYEDLKLPVRQVEGAFITVCIDDEHDSTEFSINIDFSDLIAAAFGMHPSLFYKPLYNFQRQFPERPDWWPINVPYDGLEISRTNVSQKKSLYNALVKRFGIETPVVYKGRRHRNRLEMEEAKSRKSRNSKPLKSEKSR
eukprot:g9267.t1